MEVRELFEGDTRLAHEAMRAHRPAYARQADFVTRVDGTQRPEGYRLAAASVEGRPSGSRPTASTTATAWRSTPTTSRAVSTADHEYEDTQPRPRSPL